MSTKHLSITPGKHFGTNSVDVTLCCRIFTLFQISYLSFSTLNSHLLTSSVFPLAEFLGICPQFHTGGVSKFPLVLSLAPI